MTTDPSAGSSSASKHDALRDAARKLGWRVGIPAVIACTFPPLLGFAFIAVATGIKDWVTSHGNTGLAAFVGAFAFTTGLALMPTYALSYGAGVFFGWQLGGALAVAGAVLGAIIGYIVWGTVTSARVSGTIDADPRAKAVRDALIGRSAWRTLTLVTLIRIPPNSPFAITNLVMSSVRVNPLIYLLGTAVGMAPRTVLAAFIGAGVGSVAEVKSADGYWKLAGYAVAVVVFIAVFMLISKWAREALKSQLSGVSGGPGPAPTHPA